MNIFLEITKDQFSTATIGVDNFGPMLLLGLKMLLIGVGTVFGVLALIWGALTLFRVVFYDMAQKKTAKADEEQKTVAHPARVTAEKMPEELVAVFAAAIAAAEAEAEGKKFRVVAFRRT